MQSARPHAAPPLWFGYGDIQDRVSALRELSLDESDHHITSNCHTLYEFYHNGKAQKAVKTGRVASKPIWGG